jgi:gas vesicle protein
MSDTRCFFYGLGIGAAAALLMAPRSGVKTRRRLASAAREGQDAILREGAELRDTVAETLDRTKRAAKTAADGLESTFDATRAQLVG